LIRIKIRGFANVDDAATSGAYVDQINQHAIIQQALAIGHKLCRFSQRRLSTEVIMMSIDSELDPPTTTAHIFSQRFQGSKKANI